jgi:predicted transcriptional regulator of viral defense system
LTQEYLLGHFVVMDKRLNKLPDIFSASEAYSLAITPTDLKVATCNGDIERLMRGVYKKSNVQDLGEWTRFEVISKGLKCKYAICLLSALSYHQLTDQIVDDVWVLIDHSSAIRHTGIRFLRKRDPMWDRGIECMDGIYITDINRTLVESIIYKSKLGPNETYSALLNAINHNKTKPWDIMKMAKSMGVVERIEKYMEPFIYGS